MKNDTKKLREFSSSGEFFDDTWVLFEHESRPYLEYWRRADGRDEDVAINTVFEVFGSDVPEDVYKDKNWANPERVASYVGSTAQDVIRQGKHEDPVSRAFCLADIGSYYGWENIDSYPLRLTALEIFERWGEDKRDDPRRALLDDQYDRCVLDGNGIDEERRAELQETGAERLLSALVSAEMGGWDFWKALGEAVTSYAGMRETNLKPRPEQFRRVVKMLEEGSLTTTADPGAVCFLTNPETGGHQVLRMNKSYKWIGGEEQKK